MVGKSSRGASYPLFLKALYMGNKPFSAGLQLRRDAQKEASRVEHNPSFPYPPGITLNTYTGREIIHVADHLIHCCNMIFACAGDRPN